MIMIDAFRVGQEREPKIGEVAVITDGVGIECSRVPALVEAV